MITDRRDLIEKLRDDYESYPADKKSECFIYRYIKEESDLRVSANTRTKEQYKTFFASSERPNAYVRLKSAYTALQKRYIGKKAYLGLYKSLVGRKEDISDIKASEEEAERNLLSETVYEFFYKNDYKKLAKKNKGGFDTGFAANGGEREHEYYYCPGKEKKTAKYNRDDIEMLYRFTIYSGASDTAASPAAALTPEYEAVCEQLYERLKGVEKDDFFVPLYIDSVSGAGVYIIGSGAMDTVSDDGFDDESFSDNCSPCFVYFGEIQDISLKEELKKELREDREKQIVLRGKREKCLKRIAETKKTEDGSAKHGIAASLYDGVHYRNTPSARLGDISSDPRRELEYIRKEEKELTRKIDELVRQLTEYDSVVQIMHIERTDSVREAFKRLRNSDDTFSGYRDINSTEKLDTNDIDESFHRFFEEPLQAKKKFPARSLSEQRRIEEERKAESVRFARRKAAAKQKDPSR